MIEITNKYLRNKLILQYILYENKFNM